MSGTALTSSLHARTPSVTVTGSTGTPARTLAFLRHPDEAGTPARILTTRTLTDPLTRTVRAFGARRLDNAATGSADAVNRSGLHGARPAQDPRCSHYTGVNTEIFLYQMRS
ncbi:hypothetical protein [Enterobacter mori]